MIGKEEAKEILLNHNYAHQCERGFHVPLQIPDRCIFEFEEGFVMYVIPEDPDGIIFGNSGVVVEKSEGRIVHPLPDPAYPGFGGPVEGVIKTYRGMMSK